MIRHMVLLRFREDVNDSLKQSIFSQLEDLNTKIDGILEFHSSSNISPETELIRGFKDLFWIDFKDEAARDAYLVHPDHVTAGKRLVEHIDGGRAGIVVADVSI